METSPATRSPDAPCGSHSPSCTSANVPGTTAPSGHSQATGDRSMPSTGWGYSDCRSSRPGAWVESPIRRRRGCPASTTACWPSTWPARACWPGNSVDRPEIAKMRSMARSSWDLRCHWADDCTAWASGTGRSACWRFTPMGRIEPTSRMRPHWNGHRGSLNRNSTS